MVQAVLVAAAIRQGVPDLQLRTLKNAKLMAPALPGDQVVIDAEIVSGEDGMLDIKARLSVAADDRRLAQISLVARPQTPTSAKEETRP